MASLLFPHEWLAVSLVCATVFGLTCFSWNHYSDSLPIPVDEQWAMQSQQEDKIEVVVDGAVRYPGTHTLPYGSLLGALLDQAEPLEEADLRSLRRNQKLRDGQHVNILVRPWITIYLSGAIERAGAHRVREGTPLSTLPDLFPLHPQAERKGLRSKRPMVDEEHIHIPFKKVSF